MKTKYLSIPQAAKLMGESRISVYKKVVSGKIKADKIGRNYAINEKYIKYSTGESLGSGPKKIIDRAVAKAVKVYGETLRKLGRED